MGIRLVPVESQDDDDGEFFVRMSLFKVAGWFIAFWFVGLIGASMVASTSPAMEMMTVVVLLLLFPLSLVLPVVYWRAAGLRLDADGITVESPFLRDKFYPWDDVAAVRVIHRLSVTATVVDLYDDADGHTWATRSNRANNGFDLAMPFGLAMGHNDLRREMLRRKKANDARARRS